MPVFDHTPGIERVGQRLRDDLIAWLGTVRPDGRPHLVPVWFVWSGESILITTQPRSQKVHNIAHQSAVTIALDDSREGHEPVIFTARGELAPQPADIAMLRGFLEKYGPSMAVMEWTEAEAIADFSQIIRLVDLRQIEW